MHATFGERWPSPVSAAFDGRFDQFPKWNEGWEYCIAIRKVCCVGYLFIYIIDLFYKYIM